ncbi:MAG TPA: hypothetical protein VIZ67_12775, partial [Acidimicrobiales bacterium]
MRQVPRTSAPPADHLTVRVAPVGCRDGVSLPGGVVAGAVAGHEPQSPDGADHRQRGQHANETG